MPVNYEIRVPDVAYDHEAGLVAGWTHGESMLPKTTEDILGLFDKGHSVLVYQLGHRYPPLGHAAITATYPDNSIEVGTIITHPDYRHKGVGALATIGVLHLAEDLFPGWGTIAIANTKSSKLFEKLGARKMTTLEVCREVWDYCATCPNLPKQEEGQPFFCCDVPYDLTPIQQMVKQYTISWLAAYVWRTEYVPPHR